MMCIQLRCYAVSSDSMRIHPKKIGQHAMVEVAYARVFWTAGGAE